MPKGFKVFHLKSFNCVISLYRYLESLTWNRLCFEYNNSFVKATLYTIYECGWDPFRVKVFRSFRRLYGILCKYVNTYDVRGYYAAAFQNRIRLTKCKAPRHLINLCNCIWLSNDVRCITKLTWTGLGPSSLAICGKERKRSTLGIKL